MKKFSKLRHPVILIVLLLTLQSCTCAGIPLDKYFGRSNTNSDNTAGVQSGMNCNAARLTSPRTGLPNGPVTVSWDSLSGAVNYRVNIYSGAVRVNTWEAAAPATSLQADVSQSAIGGTNPFELELLAFDVHGNYCRDYVTLNRESPPAVQQLPPANLPASEEQAPPAPVLATSVLTGDVYTMCDTSNRPVNLRLADGTDPALVTQELANGNLQILIASQDISSTCAISASNTTLLTCTYPAGLTTLPAEGQAVYEGTLIKTFRFDGETGCAQAQPAPNNDEGGSGVGAPPVCDPHTDSSCPVDCSDPANADLCG